MALRSGRFIGNGATTVKIAVAAVSTKDGLIRVFNTGTAKFTVTCLGSSVSVPVLPDQSVDAPVNGEVSITGTTGARWDGIYDYLRPGADIRNGHFKGAANPAIPIRLGGDDLTFYRVMNSGDYDFDVHVKGVKVETVKPAFSIDFVANDQVTIVRADAAVVEGVFDIVYESSEIRSGRFRFRPQTDPMTGAPTNITGYPHTIIDHSESGKSAWYRLFNSGVHPITVNKVHVTSGVATELVTVAPQCSADFQMPTQKQSRKIQVTTADLKNPIEGSFDLLKNPCE